MARWGPVFTVFSWVTVGQGHVGAAYVNQVNKFFYVFRKIPVHIAVHKKYCGSAPCKRCFCPNRPRDIKPKGFR